MKTNEFAKAFRFRVIIDGFQSSSLSCVLGLQGSWDQISLTRGLRLGDRDLADWVEAKDRRLVAIQLLDEVAQPRHEWSFYAEPVGHYDVSNLDNSSEDAVLETVHIRRKSSVDVKTFS